MTKSFSPPLRIFWAKSTSTLKEVKQDAIIVHSLIYFEHMKLQENSKILLQKFQFNSLKKKKKNNNAMNLQAHISI